MYLALTEETMTEIEIVYTGRRPFQLREMMGSSDGNT